MGCISKLAERERNSSLTNGEFVGEKLLTILLQKMAQCLDYDFDKGHIERAVYLPTGHGRLDMDQEAIRQGFRELLDGQRVLPLYVVNLPPLPEAEGEPEQAKVMKQRVKFRMSP